MKITKRMFTAVLLLISFFAFSLQSIQANAAVNSNDVTLKIVYTYGETKIPGAKFDIYYVADIDSGSNFTLADDFKKYPVDINRGSEDYPALTQTIYGYALLDKLNPTATGTTDSNGEVRFTTPLNGLKQGMYLVVSNKTTANGYEYTSTPYLVSLPNFNDTTRMFEFFVTSYPKAEATKIAGGDTDNTDSEPVSDSDIDVPTDSEPESDIPTDSEPKPNSDTDVPTDSEPESDVPTDSEPESDSVSDSDIPSDSDTPIDSESDIPTDSEPVSDSDPISDIPTDSDSEPDIPTDTDSENTDNIHGSDDYTNSDTPTTLTKSVLKQWDDKGGEQQRPQSVTINLLKDGEVYDTITLDSDNDWYYSWSNLDAASDWRVVEQPVDNYTVLVTEKGATFIVTNTIISIDTDSETPNTDSTTDTSTDTSTDTDKNTLPQTGTLWWAVPILLTAGLALYFIGYIIRRKDSSDN